MQRFLIMALFIGLLAATANAQSAPQGPPSAQGNAQSSSQGGPPAPPAEAYAACSGKAEGDACTVKTPGGTLSGTCHAAGTSGLACAPNDNGHGRPLPPPPNGQGNSSTQSGNASS